MWTKRIEDIVAARDRALVWRFGPKGLRNSASWQAQHPRLMRLEGAASIVLGVRLIWRLYRHPPRA